MLSTSADMVNALFRSPGRRRRALARAPYLFPNTRSSKWTVNRNRSTSAEPFGLSSFHSLERVHIRTLRVLLANGVRQRLLSYFLGLT